jgi:hypothetical protein
MFCIAAFIVLLVMSAVSARYRCYLGRAWRCVARRVTFRPCDTSFKQDMTDRLLAPIAVRSPALVRPAGIALEVVAVLIIASTLWSGYTVVKSGLNLYVYGTCNKQDSASCSLGAEACAIPNVAPSFLESVGEFDLVGAFVNEVSSLGETIAAIPVRMQNWDATDYLPENVSYLGAFDADKTTAVEVIDPGCTYCRELFRNIREARFDETHNLAYIAYPIAGTDGYKFANSLLVTQYLKALRIHQPVVGGASAGGVGDGVDAAGDTSIPVDWRVLERIYTGETSDGVPFQSRLNGVGHAEAVELLDGWLSEFGLTDEEIVTVADEAASDRVAGIIAANRALVEEDIHTVKVPSIIFDGRRHDGVVSVGDLAG